MEVITVANNKGGVGKTMQAYQLVCYLANKGHRVLAIDLDSQANLSTTLGVHMERTLIPEWLIGDISIKEVIVPIQDSKKLFQNIALIPSSRHLANLSKLLILSENEIRKDAGRKERLLKWRLKELEQLDEKFDYIVIDTPPMLGDELIMGLVAGQRVLIPTQAQDYSIDGLEELMDTLDIIKKTENPHMEFSIIPSMVNPRRKIERQRLEELSQQFPITPVIRNLVEMQESIATQRPICLMSKRSRAVEDYESLWKSLNL
jgi:chromosome partitioning protein